MILNNHIIGMIKEKSGLFFDKAKDYDALCNLIFLATNRTIGVNTVKRLMGYIIDDRNANEYTLNTIAIYLNYSSWNELCGSIRIDSDWNYDNTQTVYVDDLPCDCTIIVKYLNRTVSFKVVKFKEKKMLQVLETHNSSLSINDLLIVERLSVGEILESKCVYRGKSTGNYKTNGELREVIVDNVSLHNSHDKK